MTAHVDSDTPPKVTIKLELTPQNYQFSNPTPPTLTICLISHASSPLTIKIPHGSPLDVPRAMNQGAFPIFDLTTSPPTPVHIGDLSGYISVPPSPNKTLTLFPEDDSQRLTVAFNRGGSFETTYRPEPWEVVQKGRVLDKDGNLTGIRRPSVVTGVDGLEPGKRYRTTVDLEKLKGVSWWLGANTDGEGNEFSVTPITFEVDGGGVEFSVEI